MTTQSIFKNAAAQETVMALYDRLLENWPVAYESRFVTTRHGDTHVIVSGAAQSPPLILLHGAGSNATMWGGDVGLYSTYYRVYAVDLPGEPGRSAQNRPPMDSPAYAEWLQDVLDGLGIGRAVVVGISRGGWMALKFAVTDPERVAALVLICPSGIAKPHLKFLPRVIVYSMLGDWGLRRLTRALFAEQPIPPGTEDVLITITRNVRSPLDVPPIFTDAELGRLTMPVMLLGGGRDVLVNMPETAARLTQVVPQTVVEIDPTAGHAIINTAGRVQHFLAGQSVPAG